MHFRFFLPRLMTALLLLFAALHARVAGEVRELCAKFPAPGLLL